MDFNLQNKNDQMTSVHNRCFDQTFEHISDQSIDIELLRILHVVIDVNERLEHFGAAKDGSEPNFHGLAGQIALEIK
jgi:hypothetical protein